MRWFKSNNHPARKLIIEPPRPDPERFGIAVAACVKNEEPYIEEWVRFHLAVGVRHFYVYDDGSSDKTRQKLANLFPPEVVTVVPWISKMLDGGSGKPLNGQVIAFAHAILNHGAGYRWMAFIDVDEFLLPKVGSSLDEALKGSRGAPNISLPWHMFGTNGHQAKPEGPVVMNYTTRHNNPMSTAEHVLNFKCIVDPCEVTEVSVHHFSTRSFGDATVNDAGRQATRSGRKAIGFYSSDFLQLNHYYTKSRDELAAKVGRGWSHDAEQAKYARKVARITDVIERDTIEDSAMVNFVIEHHIFLGNTRLLT